MADLKFLKGSSVRFESLNVKDPNYFYLVSNTDGTIDFYLGDKLIAKGSTIGSLIAEIDARKAGDAELQRQINSLDLSGALANLKLSDSPVDGQYISSVSQANGLISVTRANLPDYSEVYASKSIEETVSSHTSAINTLTGTGEGSVSDAVSKGIASVVGGASDAFDTLKEIADYVQSDPQGVVALSNTVTDLSGRMVTAEGEIDALQESAKSAHSHGNKALLDTYAQTEESLADAVAKKHEHANLTVLNGITNDNVTEWNGAKAYAEGKATEAKNEAISQASALAAQALLDAESSAASKYQVKGEYEKAGAAAQALVDAKADAAALYQPKGEYEKAGAAAQALVDAKADAAALYQPKGEYEEAGAAAQALVDAKADAAALYQPKGNYEEAGAADAALAAAQADAASKYQVKGNYEEAGAAAQALVDAKADAASKYQVKGNYEEAGAAAQALVDAKADAAALYQPKGEYEEAGAAAQALVDAKADAAAKYALQTALDAEISQRKGLLGSDNIQVEMNSETGIQTIKLIWGEF